MGSGGEEPAARGRLWPLTALPLLCSDGEALGGNPMVAGFQDDVDLEDQPRGKALLPSDPVPSTHVSLSSEEEAEVGAGHSRSAAPAPQQCSQPEPKRYGGAPRECPGAGGQGSPGWPPSS